jgi:cardiolipin synthase
MTWNPPNLISLLRLLLAPVVVWLVHHGRYPQALVVFWVAGVTDMLDGYLARRFNWGSRLGTYLDPVADKVLLVVVFIALGVAGALPEFLVILVLGRDILILAMCAVAYSVWGMTDFVPSIWGKISTTIQILTVLVVVAQRAHPDPVLEALSMVGVALTTLATAWSGVHYVWTATIRLREAGPSRIR